jgi:predicted SAM-dependent methyltransferase
MSQNSPCVIDKLHLGCGPGPQADGWIHQDGSWNAQFAKFPRVRKLVERLRLVPEGATQHAWRADILVADLRRPLPFAAESFDAIYSSHVFEHLYEVQAARLLRECIRLLRPGGIFRIVVPDLHAMVQQYLDRKRAPSLGAEPLPADWLNKALHLRTAEPSSGFLLHRIYLMLTEFHTHKWMYDGESLKQRLITAGLEDVEERDVWDSRIPDIASVEKRDRLLAGAGVCLEGIKPPVARVV